jgi:diamine N-acetyltransferase
MLTLTGDKIYLRALEPEDLEFLFATENDEQYWEVSSTSTPYSRFILKQYLENSHKDIYEVKQLRLMICESDGSRTGFIDLFDFDPKNSRAAVGIIIKSENSRQRGFGAEALTLLCNYCFSHLELHQVYANVGVDNLASRLLFEKLGFEKTAHMKDWVRVKGCYKDELLYQLINRNVH